MHRSLNPFLASRPSFGNQLAPIRRKLARAMVGCTVDLLAEGQTIAHGIVAGVSVVAGTPKILVNGQLYDMNQVLTSTASTIH